MSERSAWLYQSRIMYNVLPLLFALVAFLWGSSPSRLFGDGYLSYPLFPPPFVRRGLYRTYNVQHR